MGDDRSNRWNVKLYGYLECRRIIVECGSGLALREGIEIIVIELSNLWLKAGKSIIDEFLEFAFGVA